MSAPQNITVSAGTTTIVMTGAGLWTYGKKYLQAALRAHVPEDPGYDPVAYQLYCQSIELFLKSFIWLQDRKTAEQIRHKYGHDLVKLWRHSKVRGIARYAAVAPLRDRVIELIGPYYRDRRFAYFDLDLIAGGYAEIGLEPRAIPTLRRLAERLDLSLRSPVLAAA